MQNGYEIIRTSLVERDPKARLITSHLLELTSTHVTFEYEFSSTTHGWFNLVAKFSYSTVENTVFRPDDYDNRNDGLYKSIRSRIIDIVSHGMVSECEEKEVAELLFKRYIK